MIALLYRSRRSNTERLSLLLSTTAKSKPVFRQGMQDGGSSHGPCKAAIHPSDQASTFPRRCKVCFPRRLDGGRSSGDWVTALDTCTTRFGLEMPSTDSTFRSWYLRWNSELVVSLTTLLDLESFYHKEKGFISDGSLRCDFRRRKHR
jgi:hypothetical protein